VAKLDLEDQVEYKTMWKDNKFLAHLDDKGKIKSQEGTIEEDGAIMELENEESVIMDDTFDGKYWVDESRSKLNTDASWVSLHND